MPALTKDKALKTVLLPEATAHSITREIELNEEQVAKLQSALNSKFPIKMSIGLRSKLWAIVDGADEKMTLTARLADGDDVGVGDGDEEIIDEDLTPPDDGEEIPEEEEEEEEQEEQVVAAERSISRGNPKRRKLVGASVKIYAVAVFRPRFKKA